MKRHMVALTYMFKPDEELFDSMLAPKDGDLYNSVVNRIYTAPKAFERIENWKDLYQHWWEKWAIKDDDYQSVYKDNYINKSLLKAYILINLT